MKRLQLHIAVSMMCMFILAAPTGFCGDKKRQVKGCEKEQKDSAYAADGKVGQVFEILLDSNPTVSPQWQLVSPPDEKVLKFVDTRYRPPPMRMAGPTGKAVWTFKALSPGRAVIVFGCLRPWEKGRRPVKTVTVTINIR